MKIFLELFMLGRIKVVLGVGVVVVVVVFVFLVGVGFGVVGVIVGLFVVMV